MREYNGDSIEIDGRSIWYRLVTAFDYLEAKGYSKNWKINGFSSEEESWDNWVGNNYEIYCRLTQIMGLKQSCFLLRRTRYSCQSLSDQLFDLKNELISELENKYNFIFDDEFVENYGHKERE